MAAKDGKYALDYSPKLHSNVTTTFVKSYMSIKREKNIFEKNYC